MNPRDEPGVTPRIPTLCLLVVLGSAAWLATVVPNPPAPVPANAPATEFSAERALIHLQTIAQKPHPIGSPASAAVREYIAAQLKSLGLEPETQAFPYPGSNPPGTGVNVMARIAGAHRIDNTHRAVALVCHYDSVPTSPGTGDDGSAVAALLETARALKSGPAVENDIILLFTDGEEVPRLLGAEAFATGHAWMKDLGLVLNFDARGVSGPVFMFETGPGNGRVISEFAQAAPRPVANSLQSEIYTRMPNDTDFTVFKGAGLPGLNFAFIGEPRHYHAATDDTAHFDPHSLQHQGSYALTLARHFGNLDLAHLGAPDAVYFDLLGRALIRYPGEWAMPLALLVTALFIAVMVREIKGGSVSPGQLAVGSLAFVAALLLIGTLFWFAFGLTSELAHSAPAWFARFFWGLRCWSAVLGLTVALYATVHLALRRWIAPANLALGAMAGWTILAIASARWVPGASYVLVWPLLFSLLGILTSSQGNRDAWQRVAWLAVAGLPTVILLAPLVHDSYVALGPQVLIVPTLVLTLGLGALSPQIEAISRAWRWLLPVAGVLIALLAIMA